MNATPRPERYPYQVRHNDNPGALPHGTYICSQHKTLEAARKAITTELNGFRKSVHCTGGAYLPRIIVQVDTYGAHLRTLN